MKYRAGLINIVIVCLVLQAQGVPLAAHLHAEQCCPHHDHTDGPHSPHTPTDHDPACPTCKMLVSGQPMVVVVGELVCSWGRIASFLLPINQVQLPGAVHLRCVSLRAPPFGSECESNRDT